MRSIATLLACLALLLPAAARGERIDPTRSRIEFDLRTRWGGTIRGHFPSFDGRVDTLADGRRQVRFRLDTAQLEIAGSPRYTRLARGPALFDAPRFPWIEFVSEPYAADLPSRGGAVRGRLRMHGVEGVERFTVAPPTCARPGADCDLLAEGRVSRDDYALDGWQWAVADRVRFRLHVRFADD